MVCRRLNEYTGAGPCLQKSCKDDDGKRQATTQDSYIGSLKSSGPKVWDSVGQIQTSVFHECLSAVAFRDGPCAAKLLR